MNNNNNYSEDGAAIVNFMGTINENTIMENYAELSNNAGSGNLSNNQVQPGAIARPTTRDVAMNSQADQLAAQYARSTYQALNLCRGNGEPLKTIQLETRVLQVVENANPQFLVKNNTAGNQTLIFGSVLALQGQYQFYNQPVSAADSAAMADQFGANVLAIQGFSNLCNLTPVVITVFQIISSDGQQVAQPLKYGDISYDSNLNTIVVNTTSTFTRYDTNTGLMKAGGLWPVGPQSFLSVLSLNDVDMTVTLTLGSTASIRTFRQI